MKGNNILYYCCVQNMQIGLFCICSQARPVGSVSSVVQYNMIWGQTQLIGFSKHGQIFLINIPHNFPSTNTVYTNIY